MTFQLALVLVAVALGCASRIPTSTTSGFENKVSNDEKGTTETNQLMNTTTSNDYENSSHVDVNAIADSGNESRTNESEHLSGSNITSYVVEVRPDINETYKNHSVDRLASNENETLTVNNLSTQPDGLNISATIEDDGFTVRPESMSATTNNVSLYILVDAIQNDDFSNATKNAGNQITDVENKTSTTNVSYVDLTSKEKELFTNENITTGNGSSIIGSQVLVLEIENDTAINRNASLYVDAAQNEFPDLAPENGLPLIQNFKEDTLEKEVNATQANFSIHEYGIANDENTSLTLDDEVPKTTEFLLNKNNSHKSTPEKSIDAKDRNKTKVPENSDTPTSDSEDQQEEILPNQINTNADIPSPFQTPDQNGIPIDRNGPLVEEPISEDVLRYSEIDVSDPVDSYPGDTENEFRRMARRSPEKTAVAFHEPVPENIAFGLPSTREAFPQSGPEVPLFVQESEQREPIVSVDVVSSGHKFPAQPFLEPETHVSEIHNEQSWASPVSSQTQDVIVQPGISSNQPLVSVNVNSAETGYKDTSVDVGGIVGVSVQKTPVYAQPEVEKTVIVPKPLPKQAIVTVDVRPTDRESKHTIVDVGGLVGVSVQKVPAYVPYVGKKAVVVPVGKPVQKQTAVTVNVGGAISAIADISSRLLGQINAGVVGVKKIHPHKVYHNLYPSPYALVPQWDYPVYPPKVQVRPPPYVPDEAHEYPGYPGYPWA